MNTIAIAPSLLAANALRLGDEATSIVAAGADRLHVDVMDGHFVPNLTFGPEIVRRLAQTVSVPLDVHLMVSNPDAVIESYLGDGTLCVGFHIEAAVHARRIIDKIHNAGHEACIALNPGTSVSAIDAVIDVVEMVRVMSVNPGFGGQPLIDSAYRRIALIRHLADEAKNNIRIEVDGGVNLDNAAELVQQGADTLVAGSALFGADDRTRAIADLRAAALGGHGTKEA